MEVIDALVMAFPALGLAKIVWAARSSWRWASRNFLGADQCSATVAQGGARVEVADGEVKRMDTATRTVFVYREARPAGLRFALSAPYIMLN